MKLHPEELEIESFATDALAAPGTDTVVDTIVDTNHPTPATHCFVCD